MANVLWIGLWAALVLLGIAAMQWGSSRICALLGTLRAHWGLPATVGGAFMGLATASPEISVNVASVAFGWPDLGLGAALGSNVPALPLVFLVAYLSTRFARGQGAGPAAAAPAPRVQSEAVEVQVVPYLLIVLLLAGLTLPPAWAGLQPIDAVLLLAAYGLYMAHALGKKTRGEEKPMPAGAIRRVLLALPVIAVGALASVIASRKLVDLFGISDLVGGLFIIGLLCALPESFAAWRLAREDKTTTAVSGAVADGIVSLTLALIPPAIVGASVGNTVIYLLNLVFLIGTLLTYIAWNHRSRGQEISFWRVSLITAGYATYVVATVVVLRG